MKKQTRTPRKAVHERAASPNVRSPAPPSDVDTLAGEIGEILSQLPARPSSTDAEPNWINNGAVAISFHDPISSAEQAPYATPYWTRRTGDAAVLGALGCVRAIHSARLADTGVDCDDAADAPTGSTCDALAGVALLLELAIAAHRAAP